MKFTLKADTRFEAADLDDALLKLSEHFADLVNRRPSGLVCLGPIQVAPVDERLTRQEDDG